MVEIKSYLEINWQSVSSMGVVWEALKAVIRGRIIQHTSYHKKIRTQELLELENIIKQTETQLKQRMARV